MSEIDLFGSNAEEPQKTKPISPNKYRAVVKKDSPKGFLASYMSSPIYKKRLSNFQIQGKPDVQNVLNAKMSQVNGPGSSALNQQLSNDVSSKKVGYPVIKGFSNINIDRSQVPLINKQYGVNSQPDNILSHELSHVSRDLSKEEEEYIASINKKESDVSIFNDYKKQGDLYDSTTMKPIGLSDYINTLYEPSSAGHDASPKEIKADLDALRFNMFKNGIYDTSKRPMTPADYKKVKNNPTIKKSLEFKRLMDRFKPSDIIKLNNTIANNNNFLSKENNV